MTKVTKNQQQPLKNGRLSVYAAGMTAREISELSGVPQNAVWRINNGTYRGSLRTIGLLSATLGAPFEELAVACGPRSYQTPMIEAGIVLLPLTQGKKTLIDYDDYVAIRVYAWRANRRATGVWDAISNLGSGSQSVPHTSLSRLLMGPLEDGYVVDHINGDTLDNRRVNLRMATHTQNHQNRHRIVGRCPYKGVSWDVTWNRWRVQIRLPDGNRRFVGRFTDPVEAAHAYDDAAIKYFGEFACTNFPVGAQTIYGAEETVAYIHERWQAAHALQEVR